MQLFFFQAEDGIRDLVRSRGLGDVYKRQTQVRDEREQAAHDKGLQYVGLDGTVGVIANGAGPVSYTHLTLPTSDLV